MLRRDPVIQGLMRAVAGIAAEFVEIGGNLLARSLFKSGVFHLQQIEPVSLNRLEMKLGSLTTDEFRMLGKSVSDVSQTRE